MAIKTYQENERVQLSKNFNSYEFRCGIGGYCACSTILIDDQLVEYLQKIRDHFGKSVNITSAYRCPSYNSKVSNSKDSYHTKGMACDFQVSGVAPSEVAKYAESIGVKGIGLYSDFVHIDTRTSKYFWYGHEQSPRTTFGGTPVTNTTSSAATTSTSATNTFVVGKTYTTQVSLAVREGASTGSARKTYSQLTLGAKKCATSAGYLKSGTKVTCLEVKQVGDDLWIRIPSGWCAAYYQCKYYIK